MQKMKASYTGHPRWFLKKKLKRVNFKFDLCKKIKGRICFENNIMKRLLFYAFATAMYAPGI